MVFTSYYSVIILVVNVMLSYVLAISMMLLLAQRFFSWFRSKKNVVILLYGLASATIAIELGLALVITNALFESINRTTGGAGLISMSPVYPVSITSLMNSINSFYIIFSIASFVMTWIATALLLRHYSLKLRKSEVLDCCQSSAIVFFVPICCFHPKCECSVSFGESYFL